MFFYPYIHHIRLGFNFRLFWKMKINSSSGSLLNSLYILSVPSTHVVLRRILTFFKRSSCPVLTQKVWRVSFGTCWGNEKCLYFAPVIQCAYTCTYIPMCSYDNSWLLLSYMAVSTCRFRSMHDTEIYTKWNPGLDNSKYANENYLILLRESQARH